MQEGRAELDDPGSAPASAPAKPAGGLRPGWQPLDRDGRERPRFLAGFPVDPQLDPLIDAFCEGNFALIRREAPRLAAANTDERVRAAALELHRRIQPDPVVRVLLLLSLCLLAWIVAWAY